MLMPGFKQPESLTPEIPYRHNNIIFHYAGLSFENESDNTYSYFLEGFDDAWSAWTYETKKEYTNLHEGDYIFKVKSKNAFGAESDIASFRFTINSPWYRRTEAYFTYFILFILLAYFTLKLNNMRLKAANQKLEQMVEERTFEIKQQRDEIVTQNEEITQQNEEIKAQAEYLSELNKELEKLSIVASETDNAILIMDREGNFEWVNESLTRQYGYTLTDYIHEKGGNILQASGSPEIKALFKECVDEKKPVTYKSATNTREGKKIWTQTTLTPILDEKNEIKKVVAIDTDITELKNAEEEIQQQNEEIRQQNEEIQAASEQLRITNTKLEQSHKLITSSITYAKHIQEAILPPARTINKMLPESFVFFKPRDIVSGDFYWFGELNDKLLIAVADCTGHGVPGAFMSMIGNTLISEIVNKNKISVPSKILAKLNEGVISSLHQDEDNIDTQFDGMDMSICSIDKKSKKIQLAGANQNMYVIDEGEMKICEGDIFSIGGIFWKRDKVTFTNHTFHYKEGLTIYLMSDGFNDQFGGRDNSKFMEKRMKKLILESWQLPMKEQLKKFNTTFELWKGNKRQIDDVIVVGFRL